MGTTSFAHYGRTSKELTIRELEFKGEKITAKVTDIAQRGNIFYALVEYTPNDADAMTAGRCTYVTDDNGTFRSIVVAKTSRQQGEFYIKLIGEESGPYEKDCPKRILQAASPLADSYNGFAREWRKAVESGHAEAKTAKSSKPKPGQKFITDRPVRFNNGVELSRFTCEKREGWKRTKTVYTSPDSYMSYRFNPAAYGFKIVESFA